MKNVIFQSAYVLMYLVKSAYSVYLLNMHLKWLLAQEKLKNSPDSEKDSIKRRSRHSTSSNQDAIDTDIVIAQLDEIELLKDAESSPKETSEGK